jgi:hypothetical protein
VSRTGRIEDPVTTGPHQQGDTTADASDVLVPITLELSPIRGLLIVDVADDPTYRTLEPQLLDGPGGVRLVLLAYRHDGQIELYAEPDAAVDPSGYGGLEEGLLGIERTDFDPARFEVTDDGLQVDIAFTAPNGRRIELHIHEHLARGRDRIAVLAPVGGAFTTPEFFPFLWLPGMSFVPARRTEAALRVDGQARSIRRLPLPIGGRRCLMARYDLDVLVCQLNPDRSDLLQTPASRTGAPRDDGPELVDVDGRPGLAGAQVRRGAHTCAVRLDPPVPDLRRLSAAARLRGTVELQADGVTELRGRYEVARTGDRVTFVIDGIGPWRSRQRRPLLAALFHLPLFRRWPSTYRWDATLDLGEPSGSGWTSRWSRDTPAG